jgi:hypothetical protein
MAVLKIFPEKDATLYSAYPSMNTGLDEIIEASLTTFTDGSPSPQASRFLVQFADDDIDSAIALIPANKYQSGSWNAKLQCFVAESEGLSLDTTVKCFPVAKSWGMGTGHYLDVPMVTNGTSWVWSDYSGSTPWVSSIPTGATSSYTSSVFAGGGIWYTGSQYSASVTFNYRTDKDIDLNVTNTVRAWTTSSVSAQLPNYGFIVKQDLEFVDNNNYQPQLKYFSVDTNTIYPPALQISWDDFSWNTGSSTQTVLNTLPATINLAENPGIFYNQSINRFRLNARPEFPVQLWTTSSVYLNNYFLPSGSTTWAIKDLETNEYVVNFDNTYTQVSADATSSYFDVYMDFLQPERYYTILIKTTVDGSTIVFNNQYSFKVVNG